MEKKIASSAVCFSFSVNGCTDEDGRFLPLRFASYLRVLSEEVHFFLFYPLQLPNWCRRNRLAAASLAFNCGVKGQLLCCPAVLDHSLSSLI